MKKSLLFFTLLCFGWMSKAQVHQHDGFYLSMAAGPVFGGINKTTTANAVIYSGIGPELDFKLGGAVKENIILHGTLSGKSFVGTSVDSGSNKPIISNRLSIAETFLGGGVTYYIMPSNFFVSASVGIGSFRISSTESNRDVSTQNGFSMQLRAGKEWWVSDNWGFGIAITYGKTVLTSNIDYIITTEDWDSNRFGVLFSATFN